MLTATKVTLEKEKNIIERIKFFPERWPNIASYGS